MLRVLLSNHFTATPSTDFGSEFHVVNCH
jgi:hypothetical protein